MAKVGELAQQFTKPSFISYLSPLYSSTNTAGLAFRILYSEDIQAP